MLAFAGKATRLNAVSISRFPWRASAASVKTAKLKAMTSFKKCLFLNTVSPFIIMLLGAELYAENKKKQFTRDKLLFFSLLF
jgi:hypothetical protein